MQPPPALSLVCHDGGAWRMAVAALHGLAAAAVLAWLAGPLSALAALPLTWFVWRYTPERRPLLSWDGQGWRLDGRAGRAGIALDLGPWLLLRFDADDDDGRARRRSWFPLSPAAGAWPAVCAALVATAATREAPDPARVGAVVA
jgi:hypothetical protein